jgi:hypothetical protein
VDGDRESFLRLGREQFHAWLREKRHDADRLESGRPVRFGDGVTGLVLERTERGGPRAMRARLVEDDRKGRWTTELTMCLPHRADRQPWLLLDVDAPAGPHSRRRWTGTPRVAKHLLGVLSAYDGTGRLGPEVHHAGKEDVEEILEVACDPDRRGMAFVAGSDTGQDFDGWMRTVQQLLRETAGLAACYLLDPIATEDFNAGIGSTHRVSPGNVRTYLPGADPAVEVDAKRHRELSARRIEAEPVVSLARVLGHRARETAISAALPKDVLRVVRLFEQEIDDVAVAGVAPIPRPRVERPAPAEPASGPRVDVRAEPALLDLLGELDLRPADPEAMRRVVELARSGLRRESGQDTLGGLRADLKVLRERIAEQADLNEELRRRLDATLLDHAVVDEERARAERTVRYLRRLLVDDGRAAQAWSEPEGDEPVSGYEDLLPRLEGLDRVTFTGDCRHVEDLVSRDPYETCAVKAWEAALALQDYAEFGLGGGVDAYLRDVPAGRHGFSRNRHAAGESDDVRSNPRYRAARVFPVPVTVNPDGRVAMWAHFKLTQSGQVSPRMHYYDDTARSGHVYIGYIGKHLPTKQTN